MGLLSKLTSRSKDARAGASTDATDIVRDARTKARRRLIGAAMLLGVGIIGFPLLFETQPRPIAVDIPIEIPSRESVAPLQSPASRPARSAPVALAPPPIEAPANPVPTAVAPKAVDEAPSRPAAEPKAAAAKPAEVRPEPKAEPKAEPKPKPPEVKPAAKPPEPAKPADNGVADSGRYVVQIGAFAEATGAREARMKVEGLGLKTYTQVIESATGRRIRVRVGPYATKAEADKAAARIKAGGLQAAVLVL
jgi:DedD protein